MITYDKLVGCFTYKIDRGLTMRRAHDTLSSRNEPWHAQIFSHPLGRKLRGHGELLPEGLPQPVYDLTCASIEQI